MAELPHSPKLARLHAFFESTGSERMQGLDASYFDGMNDSEKAEAWAFLEDRFDRSSDRIIGLVLLDPVRAVELFKQAVASPIPSATYPAVQRDIEGMRLLMLRQIIEVDPRPVYFDDIVTFARSSFPAVRAAFAKAVPRARATIEAVAALENMILSETELSPRSAAIFKLMSIYGMRYDSDDPIYKSIYSSLVSHDLVEKRHGLQRLYSMQEPDYIQRRNSEQSIQKE